MVKVFRKATEIKVSYKEQSRNRKLSDFFESKGGTFFVLRRGVK